MLFRARTSTRAASTEHTARTARLISPNAARTVHLFEHDRRAYDAARAARAAGGFTDDWLGRVRRAIAEQTGGPTRSVFRGAERKSAWKLESAASTEVSEAWNDQHRLDAVALAREPGVELWKVWDAMLDACPICELADGTAVRVYEDFPQGTPGAVHLRCRCQETLLPIDLIDR